MIPTSQLNTYPIVDRETLGNTETKELEELPPVALHNVKNKRTFIVVLFKSKK